MCCPYRPETIGALERAHLALKNLKGYVNKYGNNWDKFIASLHLIITLASINQQEKHRTNCLKKNYSDLARGHPRNIQGTTGK